MEPAFPPRRKLDSVDGLVSASLIASAGTASITVASGGQTSAPVSFAIKAPSGNSGPYRSDSGHFERQRIANGSCSHTPLPSPSFTTSSPQVWVYFSVAGATVGDSATVNFVRPDGVVYGTYNPSVAYTSECFLLLHWRQRSGGCVVSGHLDGRGPLG